MHHKEIGQLVKLLDECLEASQQPYLLKVESTGNVSPQEGLRFAPITGIKLIGTLEVGQIVIEIDVSNQDSNQCKYHCYQSLDPDASPCFSLRTKAEGLQLAQAQETLDALIQVIKNPTAPDHLRKIAKIGTFFDAPA
jgi:hypothetical protein